MHKERSINDAINWTKDELIPHFKERTINHNLSPKEWLNDLRTVTTVINIQATHLEESSEALIKQGIDLLLDTISVVKKNK